MSSMHAFRGIKPRPPSRRSSRPPAARNPSRRLRPRAGTGGLLALAAVATAGCSVKGADNTNLILGKQAFVGKCGSCHTLARAATKGSIGPNLDVAFRVDLAEGLERNTVRGVVERQIEIPNPQGAMPKDLATGATRSDIAAYVAQSVDRPTADSGLLATAVEAPGAGKPAVEKAGKLQIAASASGQLAYVTSKASATSGPVAIEMPNTSGVTHNIAIEAGAHAASGSAPVLGASQFVSKGAGTLNVALKPGVYTFFCQVPGHRAAGMFGTLTVK
jgi:mono/diheme cytochrome c family protein